MTRSFVVPITILGVVSLFASCTIPFRAETNTWTVEIPVSPTLISDYQEDRVALPAEARREGVQFTQVRFHYTATTDSGLEADVEIWISQDQTVDGAYDPATDNKIVDVTLSRDETSSGWAESSALTQALNAKQEYIVVGGFAESLFGGGSVTISGYAEISGSVDFP